MVHVPPAARAIVVSVALHAAALAAMSGLRVARSDPPTPVEDASFELRTVERRAPVDEIVVATPAAPRFVPTDSVRGGDAPIDAAVLDDADDEPPPAAAPSIAVDGGSGGRALPPEWSLRPVLARCAFTGRGHGGRRQGDGAGGEAGGPREGAAAAAPEVVSGMILIAPPAAPVRVAARAVSFPPPVYPTSARDRGLEGVVRLEADVLADGRVGDVRVIERSGAAALDAAAVAAVRAWRFEPATLDGVAEASTVALPPIRFRLD